ncbi:MAG TPA: TIGR04222 domain-containing membrane protein [Polyangiaceae bacterium]
MQTTTTWLFDLSGPSFLLAYAAITAGTIGCLALLRGILEARSGPWRDPSAPERAASPLDTKDPYLVAHLRGGEHEVVRLATVLLVDRGVLLASGDQISCAEGAPPPTHDVERAIVEFVGPERAVAASTLLTNSVLATWAPLASERLRSAGLLPGPAQIWRRIALTATAVTALVATALHKIGLAHERGRHNTGFLTAMCLLAAVIAAVVLLSKRRTPAGDRLVADLKTLFAGLRGRADDLRASASNAELALVVAVFGIGVVPGATYPFAAELFPRAQTGAWGTSCGASGCGSSGCGGGGCGGGGCGGGCGGCSG